MFVTAADFDYGDFILTNLDGLDEGEFDRFVNYHEEKELRKLLGSLFYDAFVKGLSALPDGLDLFKAGIAKSVNGEVVYVVDNIADIYLCIQATDGTKLPTDEAYWTKQAADRWVRLKWGDSFSYNNNPHKWYGMNYLIVPLIYSKWITRSSRKTTSGGIVKTVNENSEMVSPNFEIIKGWNEYARIAGGEFVRGSSLESWFYASWAEIKDTLFAYLFCDSATFDYLITETNYSSFKAYLECSFQFPGRVNDFDL